MLMVGIDLGTTTSEIAYYKKDRPETVINPSFGTDIIHSVVSINPKNKTIEVGENARSMQITDENHSVQEIKRRMGEEVRILFGDQKLSPPEISALILRHLKDFAEEALGEKIDSAVITVPANFNDKQRLATIQAGEIAGLKVARIINEPTAAALAYGHGQDMDEELVMVFDLGGGTFDVSLVEYNGNCIDVLASSGDNQLGGKDFDKLLTNYVKKRFESDNNVIIEVDSKEYRRLNQECEKAKKELSFKMLTSIHIPFFYAKDNKPLNLEIDVTRTDLEKLIAPLIDNTEKAMKLVLRDAKKLPGDVSRILLVGGSTRIPYVRKTISRLMGKEPIGNIDPDRAVALGAAIQAGIIKGESFQIIEDVCPLSLGTTVSTEIGGVLIPGLYSEILPRNSKILLPKESLFFTLSDEQTEVNFKVYQCSSLSESDWAEVQGEPNTEAGYTLLGIHEISGIPKNLAGKETLTVTYIYNPNGQIDISVRIDSTKEVFKFVQSISLDNQSIEEAKERINKSWEQSNSAQKVKSTIKAAENRIAEGVSVLDEKKINDLVARLKTALVEDDNSKIKEMEDELTDLLFNLG